MDNEKKADEKNCCSKEGCGKSGCGCGGCACKVMMAVVLLLLGGVIGYLMGAHCGYHRMGMGMWGCPMSAMQQPVAK